MAIVIKKGTSKKDALERIKRAVKPSAKYELSHLAGKLQSTIDPLEYQKKIRNEWQ